MRGLELVMQQLAAEDGEDEEDEGPPAGGLSTCLSCGHFSIVDGEGCFYCDEDEDGSFSYEDWEAYSEPEEEKAPSASADTFCGFKKSFLCNSSVPTPLATNGQDCSLLNFALPRKQQLTAEEAERNAEELLAEEERAKRKAEKKRLKKKRQKDRKRQEKRNQELEAKSQAQPDESSGGKQGAPVADVPNVPGPGPPERGSSQVPNESLTSPGCSTEEEVEEELDLTSTFVSKARLKVSTRPPLPKEKAGKGRTAQPERTEQPEAPKPGLQKSPVEQSMVLADCGNETAQRGGYWEAVLLFTEAVKLNPREYRLFGNRSFCYEKLQCYPEALHDAQVALHLQPGWPKGLFRQGKALMGLKQYADAARTFEELLRMDGFRGDAAAQLRQCHIHLLLNSVAPCTAPPLPAWNGAVQGAQLPLPGGRPVASRSPQGGRPPGSVTITRLKAPPVVLPSAVQAPVREWFPVWVGNLTPKVTQDALLRYFLPFGPIESIRCLPQKFCAFINYTRREAAEAAYAALQGVEVEGKSLQLQLKPPMRALPPATKAPGGPPQPLKREQAPLTPALALPRPNASRAKGDGSSLGAHPQRGATPAKKRQQP